MTSRPSRPTAGLIVAESTSGRFGTPWGMTSTRRVGTPYPLLSNVAAARDMTTVAATVSISSVRIVRSRGVGAWGIVWSVAIAGTSRARTKSRTDSPSAPPQIPKLCWIETTSAHLPRILAVAP